MNYFEFYGLEMAFNIDEAALRRQFLQFSKQFHPDFHSLASEEAQAEVLEKSTLNNQAYNTLKDFETRMQYILDAYGLVDEQKNRNALPQSFLMEMMEVNEALMELEFDYSPTKMEELKKEIQLVKDQLYQEVQTNIENFDAKTANTESLAPILNYYLKSKYIKRLESNLDKMQSKHL